MKGIIIRSLGLVYWPLPKNASTSIKTRIAEIEGLKYNYVHDAEFMTTDSPVVGYLNFAIVRHPLSRLHSLWKNKIEFGSPPITGDGPRIIDLNVFGGIRNLVYVGQPFSEFALAVLGSPLHLSDPHWSPQFYHIPTGVQIFKMESLSPILRLAFPTLNATDPVGLRWREAYTCDAMRAACDYYAVDFLEFDYPVTGYSL